jgi:hypothetical protein
MFYFTDEYLNKIVTYSCYNTLIGEYFLSEKLNKTYTVMFNDKNLYVIYNLIDE